MRVIIKTGCTTAGGDTNLALQVHYVDESASSLTPDQIAQFVAFAQYQGMAANCYIAGIEVGADAPGPTLPQLFPLAEYGVLQAADSNIVPMDDWGDGTGTGDLAPLGVGMVISKRSMTPGRSGRGRLTTPWLRESNVTAGGTALGTALAFVTDGYHAYIMGDSSYVPGSLGVPLVPYIYPSLAPIVNVTSTTRLGRVRSRAA